MKESEIRLKSKQDLHVDSYKLYFLPRIILTNHRYLEKDEKLNYLYMEDYLQLFVVYNKEISIVIMARQRHQ